MRKQGRRILLSAAVIVACLYSVWPVILVVTEGFGIDLSPFFSGKGIRFIGGVPYYSGGIFPTTIHYLDVINVEGFPRLVLNSTAIALINLVVVLAVGIPAAYALSRMKLQGKSVIYALLLGLRTISPFAVILPLYLIYVQSGLWDTYLGMALAYLVIDTPVVVWLVRGYFLDIPRSVYEAAEVSGATERQTFLKVALPLVLPGIAATAVFAFVLIWNEFLMANLLVGPKSLTATVGVWIGGGEHAGSYKPIDWDELNAAAGLALIPALTIVLAIRKYLARAFTLGVAR